MIIHYKMHSSGWFLLLAIIYSCAPVKKNQVRSDVTALRYLGQYVVPHNKIFNNTTLGGLSGIDYDARNDLYYLICDDRSAINPARFYSAKILVSEKGIDSIEFISVRHLLRADGQPFPNNKQDPFQTPDPEAIRYNAQTGQLFWSSEGERLIRNDTRILNNPAIYVMTTAGNLIDSFPLPENLMMKDVEKGPRQNGVFEGMTFIENYRSILVSVEEPLYEDGPRAGVNDSSAWLRFIKYDVGARKLSGQYGYRVEAVAKQAIPANGYVINGISEILSINDQKLLVIERSFSTGIPGCTIRIFEAGLINTSEISRFISLNQLPFQSIQKKLLFNMDELGIYIDNIEGVCWGPNLPNGNRTLIFVADNNFSSEEITQFLLFEVTER